MNAHMLQLLCKAICRGLLILLFAGWLPAYAQQRADADKEKPKKTRILLVLDGSGSMLAKWENSSRMDVAKRLLAQLVDSLDKYPDLDLALRVYGHQYVAESKNCQDTRLEVSFGENNTAEIKRRLDQIIPRGNTPITYSLLQSANDFPEDKNARNVLILITDGLESCGGDPCLTSVALQKKRVFLRPFIIGIGSNEDYEKHLSCMGQYFNAADIQTFQKVLDNIVSLTFAKTTVSVELKDENGKSVESNVNMTFVNNTTDEPEYNYVHFLNENGKTDVLDVDPLLSYDLVINTTPRIVEKNLKIIPGKHNVFSITAPQGYLNLRQDGPTAFGRVDAIVRESNTKNTLNVQSFGNTHRYLAGKYDLEILTLPRIYRNDVVIKQGQTTTLTYPIPGQLNIPTDLPGYGSIYAVSDNGGQQWVYNLPENSSKLVLPLLPGKYRLVFRMKNAASSKFTDVQDFTIRSGATTTVKLFNR